MDHFNFAQNPILQPLDEEPSSFFKNKPEKNFSRKNSSNDQLSKLRETGQRLLNDGKIVEGLDCYQTSKKLIIFFKH
jgi:hypothetical protein